MREYKTPEVKVLNVELTDIICTSGGINNNGSLDLGEAGTGAIG